jgi:purine-binding chemotaxis protein CheW
MSEKELKDQLVGFFSDLDALGSELASADDAWPPVETPPEADISAAPALKEVDAPKDLVAFRLGQQTYALPLEPIVQIVEMVTVTPIPESGGSLDGVINVRGAAVPVLSMRRRFGMPQLPRHHDAHIILVRHDDRMVGLIVDRVLKVLDLSDNPVMQAVDILPQELGELPLLQGIVHTDQDTVLVLDLVHLLLSQHPPVFAEMVGLDGEEE